MVFTYSKRRKTFYVVYSDELDYDGEEIEYEVKDTEVYKALKEITKKTYDEIDENFEKLCDKYYDELKEYFK
ncbi:MAG: hypothetical protein J6V66_00665 [Clostridia bacterium]|nr:hypothetical protein [Clostridia bacterium]